jgi:TorA maturation chaperone TorD
LDATSDSSGTLAAVLGDSDAALARSKAYGFLAELIAGPVSAELLAQMTSVPELALPKSEVSLDDLAAAHYELFGLQVFPHAGVFLDVVALAGGNRVADIVERYHKWGFVAGASEGPDHFACQLRFLAHLTGLEAGFHDRGDRSRAEQVNDDQRDFLDDHLLAWAVPFLTAVRAVDAPLFTQVTEMAIRVAADHRQGLFEEPLPTPLETNMFSDLETLLENPGTSVRDIAEYLLTPRRSGCWISRADIQALGRGTDVPRGFGSRAQLLSNLLRNAAEYDLADSLLAEMDSLLAKQAAAYAGISAELDLEAFAGPWLERIATTRQMVGAMIAALPLAREVEEAEGEQP